MILLWKLKRMFECWKRGYHVFPHGWDHCWICGCEYDKAKKRKIIP